MIPSKAKRVGPPAKESAVAGGADEKLLWTSSDPFEGRWRRSAAALVAVHKVLARLRDPSPPQREFLATYAWVQEAPPSAFTPVWRAPITFAWMREVFEAVGRWRSGAAPDSAEADRLLEHFKLLALATAVKGGLSIQLEGPYRAEGPLSLPGTGLRLEVPGAVTLLACDAGRLVASGGNPALASTPSVEVDGARVWLDPDGLHGLGLDYADFRPVVQAGPALHRESRPIFEEALALVQRFAPETFAPFARFIGCIGIKGFDPEDATSNTSDSRLPGAMMVLRIGEPHDLAETLIHEFHHNRLFAVEEEAPLFEDASDPESGGEGHYSPWRVDPRPLRGLFHAIYVTIPVTHYWLAVLAAGEASASVLAYARDRVRRGSLQLAIALRSIRDHARLTPRGKGCLVEIERAVAGLDRAIARSGLPEAPPSFRCTHAGVVKPDLRDDGTPLTVPESVWGHVRQYDLRGEVPVPASGHGAREAG